MTILFTSLQKSHFPLLLKWLQASHVKEWWDQDIQWTPALIEEKYGSYIQGYKLEQGVRKPFQAYVVYMDAVPMGYIQLYNAHDFPRDYPNSLKRFPSSLAALDFFIGEEEYLEKGWGSRILTRFLKEYVEPFYDACFVDTDTDNMRAIRVYEKAGFKTVKRIKESKITWMVRTPTAKSLKE